MCDTMTPEDILNITVTMIIIEGIALTILTYLVLKKGEPAKAEEIFLIYKNGLLISHISNLHHSEPDEDIVSGMLIAVQAFIKDTFETRDNSDVKKIEFGKKGIFFGIGDNISMAVVYTGEDTEKLSKIMVKTIQDIESEYQDRLKEWDGDFTTLKGIEEHSKKILVP